jgi:hypothetical protein
LQWIGLALSVLDFLIKSAIAVQCIP